jgi:hypothetical protein
MDAIASLIESPINVYNEQKSTHFESIMFIRIASSNPRAHD